MRAKARFYLKQVSAALAPSNFIGTNLELLRAMRGENLVRGLKTLAQDIEAGKESALIDGLLGLRGMRALGVKARLQESPREGPESGP